MRSDGASLLRWYVFTAALHKIECGSEYLADVDVPVGEVEQRERRDQRGAGGGTAPLSGLAALFVAIIRATPKYLYVNGHEHLHGGQGWSIFQNKNLDCLCVRYHPLGSTACPC